MIHFISVINFVTSFNIDNLQVVPYKNLTEKYNLGLDPFGLTWTDPHIQLKDTTTLEGNDKLILKIILQAAFF